MFNYLLATIGSNIGGVGPTLLKISATDKLLNPKLFKNSAVHGQLQAI